jgi:predicted AAA+ superfamily ATPase
MSIRRYLEANIRQDLSQKMVFLAGPRQSGKTTFSRIVMRDAGKAWYFNWDNDEDREKILRFQFPSGSGLLVLDEIHKYRRWRQMVKGLFDKRREELKILVTGSARLDYYRYGGDSLQGRYHFYRLHPFSVKELGLQTERGINDLLRFGGFPEPYLAKNETETRRWSREYRSRLIRDDLRDLERITEAGLLEQLALRLPELVGSPLSLNALREDLQVAHSTVRRWVEILERMYYLFRIYPFGAPRIRAVKKEAKHYHFDWTLVEEGGLRFENLVACHLLKWCHFREDTGGRDMELRYFRDIDGREVDFVLMENKKPVQFVECKLTQRAAGKGLLYLHTRFPDVPAWQVALNGTPDTTDRHGIRHVSAVKYLTGLV